ncbi:hypothetical protein RCS94_03475 [Orbaceae bacterium ac157xtp]
MEKNDLLMSLQGPINLAKIIKSGGTAPNKPGAFRHVGTADACEIELSVDTVKQTESYTGQRLQVGELTLSKSGSLTLTLKDWTPENLALALYGEVITVVSNTVVSESLPTGLIINDVIKLEHPFVSNIVVEDANGTTLTEGTDYKITSFSAGMIQLLTTAALTATVSYDYASTENLGMFTKQPPERWFLLDGINTDREDDRLIIQLFRVKFNPVSNLSLLHNEGYGELQLTGVVLADMTQQADGQLGYFGSYIRKAD